MASYPIPTNAIVEVNMTYSVDDQTCMNTFHYLLQEPGAADGVASLTALLLAFDAAVVNTLSALMSANCTDFVNTAQYVYPARYQRQEDVSAIHFGAIALPCLPSGASVVLQRRNFVAGPKSQGRIYIAGIPTAQVLDSVLSGAAAIAWQAAAAVLGQVIVDGLGNGWTPYIFNGKAPANLLPVNIVNVNDVLRYQRRREVGVGI